MARMKVVKNARATWANEVSPWMKCAACSGCAWWTGWVCRQEAVGFRECPEYGKSFMVQVLVCQGGKHVLAALKKGETAEDVRKRWLAPAANSEQPTANSGKPKAGMVSLFD